MPSLKGVQKIHPSLISLKYKDKHGIDQPSNQSCFNSSSWRVILRLQDGIILYDQDEIEVGRVFKNVIKLGLYSTFFINSVTFCLFCNVKVDIAGKNDLPVSIICSAQDKGDKFKQKDEKEESFDNKVTVERVLANRLEHEGHRYEDLDLNEVKAEDIKKSYMDQEFKLDLNRCRLRAMLFRDQDCSHELATGFSQDIQKKNNKVILLNVFRTLSTTFFVFRQ